MKRVLFFVFTVGLFLNYDKNAQADSVNSPNLSLNVDTNRATSTGAGAGNVAVSISTITIAEITLPEYSSGAGKFISIKVRPGFQFDTTSPVTAFSDQSGTTDANLCGINGLTGGATASVTPSGAANEVIIFNLTSGCNTSKQDLIKINGVKLRIISPEGAVGPSQTTMSVSTDGIGGAFSNQGIVAANIITGSHFRMIFSVQPGTTKAGQNLLPQISFADFGGNLVTSGANRNITLSLDVNPGNTFLTGVTVTNTLDGKATWEPGDQLRISKAAVGYVMKAQADGSALPAGNSTTSLPFNITAGDPGKLEFLTQPVSSSAGASILTKVGIFDAFGNLTDVDGTAVTLSAQNLPGGAPLLTDSSLTLLSTDGVADWGQDDNLRINKVAKGIQLTASGLGTPVFSNLFDIVPGDPNAVQYLQQPSNTIEDEAMNPPVIVQIIDSVGNGTSSDAEVEIFLNSSCGGKVSNNLVKAVSGVAIFSNLILNTPCAENTLNAKLKGTAASLSSNVFTVSSSSSGSLDSCPNDVSKAKAGTCGCGNPESDINSDTVVDCGTPRAFIKNIIPRIVSVTQNGKGKLAVQIEGLSGSKLKYELSVKGKKFNKSFNARKLFINLGGLPSGNVTLKLKITQKAGKKTIKSKTAFASGVVL